MEVIVSPEDRDSLEGKTIYTSSDYPYLRDNGTRISLHKFIGNIIGLITGKNQVIDHKNGNKFDCRRENLRVLTYSQNAQNRLFMSTSSSGFRGVYKCVCGPRWQVYCGTNFIGYYDEAEEGAIAYDKYIIKYVNRDNPTNFEYSDTDKDEIVQSDFSPKETRKRDPVMLGIYWKEKNKKYEVRVFGNNVGMFRELDEAQKVRDKLYKDYNEKKEKERLSVEILVNNKGQAIIPLTGEDGTGKFAIVDREYWHDLMKSSWYLGNHGYPSSRRGKKLWTLHEYLTREWERNPRITLIDHFPNTDKLDNRMRNLRLATRSENSKNLSETARKKLSEQQKGSVKPRKSNRKYPEDNDLPKYVSGIRGKTAQGYTVQKCPGLKTKKFFNPSLSMSEKLELALAYLRTASV